MLTATPMPRAVRLSLWILGGLVLCTGLAILYIDSQLKAEPLGQRVAALLTEAKIKGGIKKVEGSLDGTFNAEGVDLTFEDGKNIKISNVSGKLNIVATLFNNLTLEKIEVKNIEADLSPAAPVADTLKIKSSSSSKLPVFSIGTYNITGRITLADGQLIRFTARGESFDSAGHIDLRAGIAWPGFVIGNSKTSPRAEITLKADLQRPLGGAGTQIDDLLKDLKTVDLQCVAKDDSPLSAGSMSLNLAGTRDNNKNLVLNGALRDTSNQFAAQITLNESNGKIKGSAQLNLDPKKFGVLSESLPACAVTGKVEGEIDAVSAQWSVRTDANVSWSDLARYSKNIKRGTKSEWNIKADVKNTAEALAVQTLVISGNGINLSLLRPFEWKPGKDLEDTALNCVAHQAALVTLTPFLASTDFTVTQGEWSGEAEISLVKGEPRIKTIVPHRLTNLTVEQAGKVFIQGLNVELPLRAEGTTVFFAPLKVSDANGVIAAGEASLNYNKAGQWSVNGNLNINIAELASQPGWEDLPVDKLKGVRVKTQFLVNAENNEAITVRKLEAKINRQGVELLQAHLRQPFPLSGPKPTGVLLELNASKLPLESLSALVPGLKISGNLEKAELVAGFKSEGLFIRTEGAPVAFIDTSVSWKNKSWVQHCDLAASIDLLFGPKGAVLKFSQANLKNRTRSLAEGNCSIGLGEGKTSLELTGNLGALAEQPFAEAISNIATGNYQVKADLASRGEISTSLKVTDLSFKDREAKIKVAAFIGKYTPDLNGLTADGICKIQGSGLSEGKFYVTQKISGVKSDWNIKADFEVIQTDDIIPLLSKKSDDNPKTAKKNTETDRVPLWNNQTGSATISIKRAIAKGLQAADVSLRIDATRDQILLSKIQGKFAEGTLSGGGQLSFRPRTSGGPYILDAKIGLTQFDFGAAAAYFPALKDFVQGKADGTIIAEGVAPNCSQLVDQVNINLLLQSRGGRIQAFGSQNGAMSLAANKAGETANLVGGLAVLAGALTKNQKQAEKIAKVGAAISAVGKLQKSLAQFKYDSAEINIQRLPNGTLKINKTLIQNSDLRLSADGQISAQPGMSFADWPLNLKADLRGTGEYKDYFTLLGFADGLPSPDGFTQGPGVQVTGSMNDIKNDLKQRLETAINNIQSGLNNSSQSPTQGTPTGPTNIIPKKNNLFDSLIR